RFQRTRPHSARLRDTGRVDGDREGCLDAANSLPCGIEDLVNLHILLRLCLCCLRCLSLTLLLSRTYSTTPLCPALSLGARRGGNFAAAMEPLAEIPLCGSPWHQSRNPARHISPKALVLRAECLLERRFFDQHHPDMKKKPE